MLHICIHFFSRWVCRDRRENLKKVGSSETPTSKITAECQWNETYTILPSELQCVLSQCSHPHDYQFGSHQPPPEENNLELVIPVDQSNNTIWKINFGRKIRYKCSGSKHFELPHPSERDPTQDTLDVECLTNGTYNTPLVQGKTSWPNCTQTVRCGPPPLHPTNGMVNGREGYDGSITWMYGAAKDSDTYNTTVEYTCANGSQFDTDGDGQGNSGAIQSRCQWDKTWSQQNPLPPCFVTHCIVPFSIPNDTFLMEITSTPTRVNQRKQYECIGKLNETHHTRFLESDRTRSTFDMLCLPNGAFAFDNLRSSWPTCLEDVLCDEMPPLVPTHEVYTLPSDDGIVQVQAVEYPQMTRTDVIYNSTQTNSSWLPRNYMTNLTYKCGSARKFIKDNAAFDELTMTCQWNRSWTPTEILAPCDWVACLKPPTPPKSSNLRVTDWDGGVIQFGDPVHFVCERGFLFEEDVAQQEVTFDCQDGTVPGTRKGFFNNPDDDFWPKCLQGLKKQNKM